MSPRAAGSAICLLTSLTADHLGGVAELFTHTRRPVRLVLSRIDSGTALLARAIQHAGGTVTAVLPSWEVSGISPDTPPMEIQLADGVEGQFRRIQRIADGYLVVARSAEDLGRLDRITGQAGVAKPIVVLASLGLAEREPCGAGLEGGEVRVTAWGDAKFALTTDARTALSLITTALTDDSGTADGPEWTRWR